MTAPCTPPPGYYGFRGRLVLTACLLTLLSGGCVGGPLPTQAPQPPAEYLANALDWLAVNAVRSEDIAWPALREQALALSPNPRTTADTYPALLYATGQIGDWATFFLDPAQARAAENFGLLALYPQNVIVDLNPGGAAERAGLRLGDLIETVDGGPPKPWQNAPIVDLGYAASVQLTVKRADQAQPIVATLARGAATERDPVGQALARREARLGYIDLPVTSGAILYATDAHQALRRASPGEVCGWVIDLRRNSGGDLWSYLAAIGPILGEGEVGGFVYADGAREPWTYAGGKVFWNGNERFESLVEGPLYPVSRPLPPVALLTSPATAAAGELAVVAFQGRPKVRSFGEPTAGSPVLQFHTTLSDGAFLSVSGAFASDRTGRVYNGSITPDEVVRIDWTQVGTEQDQVLRAALEWLQGQPDCAR